MPTLADATRDGRRNTEPLHAPEQPRTSAPRPSPGGDPYIGRTLVGKFRITDLLGEGGMGKVYRARHLNLDKTVCIKVLRPSLLEDKTVVGRFEREAKAASRLNHAHSIQVLDFGEDESGALYIVMEYVSGKDLRKILQTEYPLGEVRICHIVSEVLSALAEAHSFNVIHRDLKPENIMIEHRRDDPDFVKVLDFGIAKIQDPEVPGLTRADVVCGTPLYMSPEQATGSSLDARSDLYAIGVILYQLTTGVLPFNGANSMEILTKHVMDLPIPPRMRRPEVAISQEMEALILRALEKDPRKRPQTAEAFREELLLIEESQKTARKAADAAVEAAKKQFKSEREQAMKERHAAQIEAMTGRRPLLSPRSDREANKHSEAKTAGVTAANETQRLIGQELTKWLSLDDAAVVASFLGELFGRVEFPRPRMLALHDHAFTITAPESVRQFFCIVTGHTDMVESMPAVSEMQTAAFIGQAVALEDYLASLPGEQSNVVVVITPTAGLSQGVRKRLSSYRQRFHALVLPLCLAEVRLAHRKGEFLSLFLERLAELHSPIDPFGDGRSKRSRLNYFGMQREIRESLEVLEEPGSVLAVNGRPGAGKSSLLNVLELESPVPFVRIRCTSAPDRHVDNLVAEITGALDERRSPKSLNDGASSVIDNAALTQDLRRTLFLAMPAIHDPRRIVLVLEDADCIITLLEDIAADPVEQQKARVFWTTLAALCEKGQLSVVITGGRTYVLGDRRVAQWDNPLATNTRVVTLPSLSRDVCARYVANVAASGNVDFDRRAMASVYRWSAGYVDVARVICSATFSRVTHSEAALKAAHVKSRDVEAVVSVVAASGGLFRDTIEALRPHERIVLKEIAQYEPRGLPALKRRLAGRIEPTDVRDALDALHRMHLVKVSSDREVVAIPLLKRWLVHDIDPSDLDRESRDFRGIFFGVGLAASFCALWLFLDYSSPRMLRASTEKTGDCFVEVFYPETGVEGVPDTLTVECRCSKAGPMAVVRSLNNVAQFERDWKASRPLPCSGDSPITSINMTPGPPLRDAADFRFAVVVGQAEVLQFTMRNNVWQRVTRESKTALVILAGISGSVGSLVTYSTSMRAMMWRLGLVFGLVRRRRSVGQQARGPISEVSDRLGNESTRE